MGNDFSTADKRPWKLSAPNDTMIVGADGTEVAETLGDYDDFDAYPRMEANAALIVAAVNAYDAAVARIEALEKTLVLARQRLCDAEEHLPVMATLLSIDATLLSRAAPCPAPAAEGER